jgi:AcrR family transcriptional regulator
MGIKERRDREKKEHRQRILDVALQIITKEGFAALSMRKLAEKIEYSAASIYLHFRNRDEIARELSEVGLSQLLEFLTVAAQEKDAVKRLRAVGEAYVDFGLTHSEMYRLIFMSDAAYIEAAFAEKGENDAGNKAYQILLNIAEDLRRSGYYRGKAASNEVADMIWTTWHGIISLKLTCTYFPMTPVETLVALMTKTLVEGLGVKRLPMAGRAPSATRKR